jgi:hypothetical protein
MWRIVMPGLRIQPTASARVGISNVRKATAQLELTLGSA